MNIGKILARAAPLAAVPFVTLAFFVRWCVQPRLGRAFPRGQLLRVTTPFEVTALTHWHAPYTDSVRCRLPAGFIAVTTSDCRSLDRGVQCVPVDVEAFERDILPPSVRNAASYAATSFVFTRRELPMLEPVSQ